MSDTCIVCYNETKLCGCTRPEDRNEKEGADEHQMEQGHRLGSADRGEDT